MQRVRVVAFSVALASHMTGTSLGRARLGEGGSLRQGELAVSDRVKGSPSQNGDGGQCSPERGRGPPV